MEQPNNIFAFDAGLKLFIFIAPGIFSSDRFADFVDHAALSRIPNQVVLVYQSEHIGTVDLSTALRLLTARFRYEPKCLEFGENGLFKEEDDLVKNFLETGITRIRDKRNPVVKPPSGKAFIKPSGKRDQFFLQASNLFVRHAEMAFLALLLIRAWDGQLNDDVETIYVDTIDLYGLTSLACRMRFGKSHGPITVSFSSYKAYERVLKRVDVRKALMVISATTSHDLLAAIIRDTRWNDPERVVTLVCLDPLTQPCPAAEVETITSKVLLKISPQGAQKHMDHLPALKLTGEKFAVEAADAKSVVLNTDDHGNTLESIRLSELAGIPGLFSGFGKFNTARAPIWVNADKLVRSLSFKKWLLDHVEKFGPLSTTHIVLAEEGFKSPNMDTEIKRALAPLGKDRFIFLTAESLRQKSFKVDGSVIVICPCLSTGTKLLEVSRDLRRQTKLKNIVYLTGIGTPRSAVTFKHLRADLQTNGFRMFNFSTVPSGSHESLCLSWKEELALLRDDPGFNGVPDMRKRWKVLEDGKLSDHQIFYRTRDLNFHKGFCYWQNLKPYPKGWPSNLLFVTLSAVLENARSDSSLPEKDQLAQLHNRQVLLDPENFFRYNDTLIQVALLRAAHHHELDYSGHDAHSNSMVYLLKRAEQVRDRSLTYELLLALATKRLRLMPGKYVDVKQLLENSTLAECSWFRQSETFKLLVQ